MSQIDWSKAPEGAIGAFTRHDGETFFVKTKQPSRYRDKPGFDGIQCNGEEYHVFTEYWEWFERPIAWNGEGLPPVGTVCEAYDHETKQWVAGRVLMRGNSDHAFASGTPECWNKLFWAGEFRPIRTPEQIAAEEREKAIKAMEPVAAEAWRATQTGNDVVTEICSALYDAGYRKVTP